VSDEPDASTKVGLAIGLLVVWALICVPFWLLGIGFAGEFTLPVIVFDEAFAFALSALFCLFFYGLLLTSGALFWSAFRHAHRPTDHQDTDFAQD
jgi:hypothetical protein